MIRQNRLVEMMLLNLCADQTLDESLLFSFPTFWPEFEPTASEINILSANISELMWQKIYFFQSVFNLIVDMLMDIFVMLN